jgi:AAA domain
MSEERGYDPAAETDSVIAAVFADMATTDHRAIIVDSPPGAGKTTLVVRAAAELAASSEECIIVAQTNNQVNDLTTRLAAQNPRLLLGRLSATDYTAPPAVLALPNVTVATRLDDLGAAQVILATAAKWATVKDRTWAWAIIDEAYQMRSDMLLLIAARFDRVLVVGDPGQLDPFSAVEVSRWIGLPYDPMLNAVTVLQAHNPDLPVHRLPVSWRLPASAAPVISGAFYPFSGFRAATTPDVRRLEFTAAGIRNNADATLDAAGRSGWALHELPARHTIRTDREAAETAAGLAIRFLTRGATGTCEQHPDGRLLGPEDIAIGVAHRDQADQIRQALAQAEPALTGRIKVDTANRLQGAEFNITIVLHPLSGRRDATTFHLETGRLCVLASRHRHACVVVARAGIADLLDTHPPDEPIHLGVAAKFPDGWEANQALLAHLAGHRVPA